MDHGTCLVHSAHSPSWGVGGIELANIKTMKANCTLCGDEDENCRHLELYVIGSEGIIACQNCCIALSSAALHLKSIAQRARMDGWKKAKIVMDAKQKP